MFPDETTSHPPNTKDQLNAYKRRKFILFKRLNVGIFLMCCLIIFLCWCQWYFPYKNRKFWSTGSSVEKPLKWKFKTKTFNQDYECGKGFFFRLQKCTDINECDQNIDWCGEKVCENSIGGFSCHCPTGLEVYDTFNVKYQAIETKCRDVDECRRANSCPVNSVCRNTEGSYKCLCNDGFEGKSLKHLSTIFKLQGGWNYPENIGVIRKIFLFPTITRKKSSVRKKVSSFH